MHCTFFKKEEATDTDEQDKVIPKVDTETQTNCKCPNCSEIEETFKKKMAECEQKRKKEKDERPLKQQSVDVGIYMKQYVSKLLGYVMFEVIFSCAWSSLGA